MANGVRAEGEVQVYPDRAALAEAGATLVAERLAAAIARRGRASLVLAGGTTPRDLYRRLATSPRRERVDWRAVDLFWGDERCVPPGDPASNFRMARETLLEGLGGFGAAPPAVHPIAAELGAGPAADRYDRELRESVGDPPRFDVVLLGMGADGHTASLFPSTPDPEGDGRLAIATRSPVEPHQRVSLTLRALGGGETVIFVVAGADKARAVAGVLRASRPAGTSDRSAPIPHDLPPAARVRPTAGRLVWMLDRAAAAAVVPIATRPQGATR